MSLSVGEDGGDPARRAIDDAVLAWIEESTQAAWHEEEVRFDSLAREVFAYQYEHCAPYRRYCEARAVELASVTHWSAIPCVPTGAFKELAIRSYAAERDAKVFRTSGTSTTSMGSAARRGALYLDTLRLYEASLMASLDRMLLAGAPARCAIRVLAPAPAEADDSSLSHMFGALVAQRGDEHSGFDVRGDALCTAGLRRELERACSAGDAIVLCGTAFAFVHWLEAGEAQYALPPGSRIMETGGFKGRARERSRAALYQELGDAFGIPEDHIVNQYGMTELASQFYDSVLIDRGGARRKLVPPWVRVRIVDPLTNREARSGEIGTITIVDLANTGSLCAIQTADLGRRVDAAPPGFEVIGREAGAEARGCSIAADIMLGDTR